MVEMEDVVGNESEEEINQESHNRLLSAVSRIYKKQRIDKPKRSEPTVNVSEFHLTGRETGDNKNKIKVYDLVSALDSKASHLKIRSKFQSTQTKSRKLPKPIEKVFADKIKRSVGYEHLKKHVSRWNELVHDNRTAPQLSFPLRTEPQVQVYQPLEFLNTFKEPTELERNMAEVLQQSAVAQQDSQVEEAIFNLTIPEMIKKRKLVAKLKARESFKIVKAMKQNKIKSKKYRRLVRKEKMKEELKEFETLQRTDPEAALEKLNKIERERAEERASLRHRNTGKWARGQAIRAKYDIEARIQLAEQLSKSRELTRKQKLGEESSSEEEGEEEEEENVEDGKVPATVETGDNPWTQEEPQEQTVEEFISGYQNYWKQKKNLPPSKPTVNKAALARLVGKEVKKGNVINNDNEQNVGEENPPCGIPIDNVKPDSSDAKEIDINSPSESLSESVNIERDKSPKTQKKDFNISPNESIKLNLSQRVSEDVMSNIPDQDIYKTNFDTLMKSSDDEESSSDENATTLNLMNKNSFEISDSSLLVVNSNVSKVNNFTIESISQEAELKKPQVKSGGSVDLNLRKSHDCSKKIVISEDDSTAKSISVEETDENVCGNFSSIDGCSGTKKRKRETSRNAKKKMNECILNVSGSWEVSDNDSGCCETKKITGDAIEVIFNRMEDKLHDKVKERLKRLEDILEDEEDDQPVKKKKKEKTVDKRRIEHTRRGVSFTTEESTLKEVTDVVDPVDELLKSIERRDGDEEFEKNGREDEGRSGNAKDPDIDPNKFLKIKPRVLNAELPDVLTTGEDVLDDPEDDRRVDISEAFAEDNVVDEFRRSKEEEVKESKVGNIDTYLPGWGSWAGHNVAPVSKRKRKRFIIRAPQQQRKDRKKPNVIINQDISAKYKQHLVSDVPYPFTSVKDYEASIRAPLGSNWVPESAVRKLTQPPVVKKIGAVIEPMTEKHLAAVNKEKKSKLRVNNATKSDSGSVK